MRMGTGKARQRQGKARQSKVVSCGVFRKGLSLGMGMHPHAWAWAWVYSTCVPPSVSGLRDLMGMPPFCASLTCSAASRMTPKSCARWATEA